MSLQVPAHQGPYAAGQHVKREPLGGLWVTNTNVNVPQPPHFVFHTLHLKPGVTWERTAEGRKLLPGASGQEVLAGKPAGPQVGRPGERPLLRGPEPVCGEPFLGARTAMQMHLFA